MHRVDLLGSPGAGKTTLRIALHRSGSANGSWIAEQAVRPQLGGERGVPLRAEQWARAESTDSAWRGFRDECAKTSERLPARFAREFLAAVDQAARIDAQPDPRWAVCDEALTTRGLYLAWQSGWDPDVAEWWWNRVPLPTLLVHMDASADVVAERMLNRDKPVPVGTDELRLTVGKWLAMADDGAQRLAARGCRVERINAEADEGTALQQVISLLEG